MDNARIVEFNNGHGGTFEHPYQGQFFSDIDPCAQWGGRDGVGYVVRAVNCSPNDTCISGSIWVARDSWNASAERQQFGVS